MLRIHYNTWVWLFLLPVTKWVADTVDDTFNGGCVLRNYLSAWSLLTLLMCCCYMFLFYKHLLSSLFIILFLTQRSTKVQIVKLLTYIKYSSEPNITYISSRCAQCVVYLLMILHQALLSIHVFIVHVLIVLSSLQWQGLGSVDSIVAIIGDCWYLT